MLDYSSFTVYCAIMFMTRTTLQLYAQQRIMVIPRKMEAFELSDTEEEEDQESVNCGSSRPAPLTTNPSTAGGSEHDEAEEHLIKYIYCKKEYESCRFLTGSYLSDLFVQSSPPEKSVLKECVLQLWKLHCDYAFHAFGIVNPDMVQNNQSQPYVLQRHWNMFKGFNKKLNCGLRFSLWREMAHLTLGAQELRTALEEL